MVRVFQQKLLPAFSDEFFQGFAEEHCDTTRSQKGTDAINQTEDPVRSPTAAIVFKTQGPVKKESAVKGPNSEREGGR